MDHPEFKIAHNPENISLIWENFSPELKSVLSQPYIQPLSKTWFDERKNGLTASEIGDVLGHRQKYGNERYSPSEKVFLLKTNQIPFDSDNIAMSHGRFFEPEAGRIYSNLKKQPTFNIGLIKNKEYPLLLVTPDLIAFDSYVVEIKCPYYRKIKVMFTVDDMKDQLHHYYDQCIMQALVTNMKKDVHFVQYGTAPNKHYLTESSMTITRIPFDEHWWPKHQNEIENFWDRVLRYRETNPKWNEKNWNEKERNEENLSNIITSTSVDQIIQRVLNGQIPNIVSKSIIQSPTILKKDESICGNYKKKRKFKFDDTSPIIHTPVIPRPITTPLKNPKICQERKYKRDENLIQCVIIEDDISELSKETPNICSVPLNDPTFNPLPIVESLPTLDSHPTFKQNFFVPYDSNSSGTLKKLSDFTIENKKKIEKQHVFKF